MATSNSTPSTRSTRAPKGAIAALPADLSNVIPFNKAKRAAQIADERAANATLDEFVRLAKKHGCHYVMLMAYLPNGRTLHGISHRSSDDGLSEVPCSSVRIREGGAA
ncbi:MAG: hypothetical protein IPN05_18550 [Sulfuritalea sp.]|jgi:hypothetical protein|nr:hypothetical protein [Sulfuritalea sp.]